MKTFDNAARARIAKGWLNSSLDPPAYAAKHGISDGTLREWIAKYGSGRQPPGESRVFIAAAIEQIQRALATLTPRRRPSRRRYRRSPSTPSEMPVRRRRRPDPRSCRSRL